MTQPHNILTNRLGLFYSLFCDVDQLEHGALHTAVNTVKHRDGGNLSLELQGGKKILWSHSHNASSHLYSSLVTYHIDISANLVRLHSSLDFPIWRVRGRWWSCSQYMLPSQWPHLETDFKDLCVCDTTGYLLRRPRFSFLPRVATETGYFWQGLGTFSANDMATKTAKPWCFPNSYQVVYVPKPD